MALTSLATRFFSRRMLDQAVSYTKGCYLGQEIIARIHWRGSRHDVCAVC
jgi:folate-binding protein YgfZ